MHRQHWPKRCSSKHWTETANAEIVTELAMGQSYARHVGVEHNVVNPNPHEFVFVGSA
jgi:hypothetical protein